MDNYQYCARTVAGLVRQKRAKILDFGCGNAQMVRQLRSEAFDAVGCDIFYEGGEGRAEVLDLISSGVVTDMPDGITIYPNDTFDVVVANQVFEHVPNLSRALEEIRRILKPGGILLALFPDRGVWREGHCGIPFLHRFPKGSKPRVWYAAALRALGIGSFKGNKGIVQWSQDFCDWLDKWTFYRDRGEINAVFGEYFGAPKSLAADWLDTRFGSRYPLVRLLPSPMKSFIVAKFAGLVFTVRKSERSTRASAA